MKLDSMTPTPLLNLLRLSTLTALAPSSARSPPPPCSHQPGAQLKRSRQSVPLSTLSAKAKKAESMSSPCPHQPGAQMKRSRQPIPLLTLSTKAKKAERMSSPPWETTHFPKKGTNPKSAGQCQAQLQWPLVIRKMIDQVSARRNPSQSKLPPFQSPLTLPLLLSKKRAIVFSKMEAKLLYKSASPQRFSSYSRRAVFQLEWKVRSNLKSERRSSSATWRHVSKSMKEDHTKVWSRLFLASFKQLAKSQSISTGKGGSELGLMRCLPYLR
mmetsp:Transcript_25954/g.65893  ORF Transcript_25954/g.65893 Transcript_25954/m.65893 type:complete len:270 (+) Transcript_25954:554-1363(+)